MKLVIIQKSDIHEFEDLGDLCLTQIIYIFRSVSKNYLPTQDKKSDRIQHLIFRFESIKLKSQYVL